MRSLAVGIALVLLAIGCDGDGDLDDAGATMDAAGPSEDGGTTADDGGTTPEDAGRAAGDAGGGDHDCDDPAPAWLACEDFEAGGGDFDTWFDGSDFVTAVGRDDRGRIDLSDEGPHAGRWSVSWARRRARATGARISRGWTASARKPPTASSSRTSGSTCGRTSASPTTTATCTTS
ncbi:MAG TPA: hypothetical protein RMH99_00345 [Sandaracinaceae bacterium LLY-WYZ-13_1]|nr:hypothetical protein [Sandaracinaceae bacterium LLY-WYZ-13_1]